MRTPVSWQPALVCGVLILLVPSASRADDERQMGHAAVDRRDFEAARGHLDRALAVSPNDAAALVDRAACWSAASNEAKALADLNRAIEVDPKFVGAWVKRGVMRVEEHPDLAIADLNQAIRLDPKNSEALSSRGMAYFLQDHRELAASDLEAAMSLGRDEQETWLCLGMIRLAQSDGPRAVEQFNKIIRVDPDRSSTLTMRAIGLLMAADYAGTLADCDRGDTLAPADSRWQLLRVLALRLQHRNAESNQVLAALTQHQPDDPMTLLCQAMNLQADGQLTPALAALNRAIQLQPENVNTYLHRAGVEEQQQAYDQALADYNRVVDWKPAELTIDQKVAGLLGQAWLWATCPDSRVRNGPRALEAALLACSLTNQTSSRALQILAAARAEVDDYVGAIHDLDAAAKLPPNKDQFVTVTMKEATLTITFKFPTAGTEPIPSLTDRERAAFIQRRPYRDSK